MAKNWTSALAEHIRKEQMENDRNRLTSSLDSLCDDYVLAKGILELLTKQKFYDWYQNEFENWLSGYHSSSCDGDILEWLDSQLRKHVKAEIRKIQ